MFGSDTIHDDFYDLDYQQEIFQKSFYLIDDFIDDKLLYFNKEYDELKGENRFIEIEENTEMEQPYHLIDLKEYYLEEIIELDRILSAHRYSTITRLWSHFESRLTNYCNSHQLQHNKEYGIDDLRGSTFEKITKYLERSVQLDIQNAHKKNYDFIKSLNHLRNQIVHHEGLCKSQSKYNQVKDLLNYGLDLRQKTLENHVYNIILSKEFIGTSMKIIFDFINFIENSSRN